MKSSGYLFLFFIFYTLNSHSQSDSDNRMKSSVRIAKKLFKPDYLRFALMPTLSDNYMSYFSIIPKSSEVTIYKLGGSSGFQVGKYINIRSSNSKPYVQVEFNYAFSPGREYGGVKSVKGRQTWVTTGQEFYHRLRFPVIVGLETNLRNNTFDFQIGYEISYILNSRQYTTLPRFKNYQKGFLFSVGLLTQKIPLLYKVRIEAQRFKMQASKFSYNTTFHSIGLGLIFKIK